MDRTEPMRIEPTMGQTNTDRTFSDMFGETHSPVFKVRFSIKRVRSSRNVFVKHRAFRGKGEISFPGEAIALDGATRTWYGRSIPTKLLIGHAQIFNAEALERHVYFDFRNADETQSLGLQADNPQEAQRIFDTLRTRAESPFEAERTARAAFAKQLEELTPTTWVTSALIAINVLVYLAMCLSGLNPLTPNGAAEIPWGTNFGPYTLDGQWWRLFTAMFEHFGFMHVAFNMFVLYQIGRMTERMYGNAPFLALYVFSGLTSSMVSTLWHPTMNSAGASGAIFGVLGGLIVFLVKYRKEVPASLAFGERNALLIYVAYVLIQGFVHKGVDYGGHIGGLIGGLAIGWPLARSVDASARSQAALASAVRSFSLACLVLCGLAYPMTHLSSDTRAELQFGRALAEYGPAEKKVLADIAALRRLPFYTQPLREEAATELRTRIVPQWDRLYAMLDEARLPEHSSRTALRDALLRYVDDHRHMERLVAAMVMNAQERNTERKARIDALQNDINVQLAAIHSMTGVRPRRPAMAARPSSGVEGHG
jgi:rhomboid protease GluP